jgi:hypothetical protein
MIIWFNCKITDQRLNPHTVVRYNLRNDNRFDIARYSFASFAPLAPLVTKFIFNLELADEHAGREAEMEAWLREILPEEKLSLHWHRCNTIQQWEEAKQEIDQIDDDLIFPAGNEDHIFLDSDIAVFSAGLEILKKDPDPLAVLVTSHYPEAIRAASHFNGTLSEDGNYVSFDLITNDAIRVMKKENFNWYLETAKDSNRLLFRTEHWNDIAIRNNKWYVPTKEQFRHFDGYVHVGIDASVCPPLEIPPGFFKGVDIKFGYDEMDPNVLNINPTKEKFAAEDPMNGVDFKCTFDAIPAVWKQYARTIMIAPDIDELKFKTAYDMHLLEQTRLHIEWPHVGATFNEFNWPPAKWINNHTKECLFYE